MGAGRRRVAGGCDCELRCARPRLYHQPQGTRFTGSNRTTSVQRHAPRVQAGLFWGLLGLFWGLLGLFWGLLGLFWGLLGLFWGLLGLFWGL
jgi:hypothetical protein